MNASFVSPTFKLGFSRMADAIKSSEDLMAVFSGMLKNPKPEVVTDLSNGALSCLVATWIGLKRHGWKATCREPDLQPFIDGSLTRISYELLQSSSDANRALCNRQISALCSAVGACKMHFTFDLSLFGKPAIDDSIAVRLVSSPDRVQTTTVERDPETLEIIKTTTRQTDFAV